MNPQLTKFSNLIEEAEGTPQTPPGGEVKPAGPKNFDGDPKTPEAYKSGIMAMLKSSATNTEDLKQKARVFISMWMKQGEEITDATIASTLSGLPPADLQLIHYRLASLTNWQDTKEDWKPMGRGWRRRMSEEESLEGAKTDFKKWSDQDEVKTKYPSAEPQELARMYIDKMVDMYGDDYLPQDATPEELSKAIPHGTGPESVTT